MNLRLEVVYLQNPRKILQIHHASSILNFFFKTAAQNKLNFKKKRRSLCQITWKSINSTSRQISTLSNYLFWRGKHASPSNFRDDCCEMCKWAATQRNAAADTQLVWHVAVKSFSLHSHTHTLAHLSLTYWISATWHTCRLVPCSQTSFFISNSVLLCAGNVSKNGHYKLQLMTSLQSNGETGDGLL
jgi:hypothetical protein